MKRSASATARRGTSSGTARPGKRAQQRSPLLDAAELRTLIRARKRSGASLRRADVLRESPRLIYAAVRHFGSWRDAVEALGFRVPGNQRWSDQRILDEILTRHRTGKSLRSTDVPNPLIQAAMVHFGSWRVAVERAGIDYGPLGKRPRLSPRELIAEIRRGAKAGRTGMGAQGLFPRWLALQARKTFGSVTLAIEAAGLDPDRLLRAPRYNAEQIAVRFRHLAQTRPEMTATELVRTSAGNAAAKQYGSVATAAAAFGIRDWPRQLRAQPSAEEVLAGIARRYSSGASMRLTEVIHDDRRLMNGAYKRFGTWRSAVRAAGLPFDDAFWSARQVKAELRARRLRREAVNAKAIERDDPKLWSAVLSCFGNLSRALRTLDG